MSSTGDTKSHVLVDCISGLPLYELTTPGNIADSSVAAEILAAADQTVSLKECTFLADKGYDVKKHLQYRKNGL